MNRERFFWTLCFPVLGLIFWVGACTEVLAQDEKPALFKEKSPVELYQLVHRAKWAVDIDTVLACTSRRVDTNQGRMHEQLMQGRSTLAQDIEFLDAKVTGKFASILVRGVRRDLDRDKDITSRGKVTLVKEDGVWRIRHEAWEDVSEAPVVISR